MGVCFKGFVELAELLILNGADVNQGNGMGGTCLIYAVTFNHPKLVKLLLEHNADVSLRDARGQTALDHAKAKGMKTMMLLLENEN